MATSKKLRELKARKSDLLNQAKTALPSDAEPTAEQQTAFDAIKTQIEGINRQIEAEEFLLSQQSAVDVADGAHIVVSDNREADPARGFR